MTSHSEVLNYVELCRQRITLDGEIPYPLRCQLLGMLAQMERNNGQHLCLQLMVQCAEKTLNIWEETSPDNHAPHELLGNLHLALSQGNELSVLKQQADRFYLFLDDHMGQEKWDYRACYAGWSCLSAVWSFLYGIDLDNHQSGEIDIDPDNWDASFYSSCAYCGGATWEKTGDSALRKEYWQWFLSAVLEVSVGCISR